MGKFSVLFVCLFGMVVVGKQIRHGKIENIRQNVGGSTAINISMTPYMVSMQRPQGPKDTITCGGAIVSPLWVVTSCHCVAARDEVTTEVYSLEKDVPFDKWKFIAGTANLKYLGDGAQIRHPQMVRFHPDCQLGVEGFSDLALVKMKTAFKFNRKVKAVNLFSFNRDVFESKLKALFAKKECIEPGWGSSAFESLDHLFGFTITNKLESGSQEETSQLKKSVRHLLNADACLKTFVDVTKERIPSIFASKATELAFTTRMNVALEDQICSLSTHKQEHNCRVDSGGPIVCDNFLVGVTIWGIGCGERIPDIHQNLVPLLDWFESVICRDPFNKVDCIDLKYRHPLCDKIKGDASCNERGFTRRPAPRVTVQESASVSPASKNTISMWVITTLVAFTLPQNKLF